MIKFPSLSERTFFRTGRACARGAPFSPHVSISFRENLLSDGWSSSCAWGAVFVRFHLFQREPSFGHHFLRQRFPKRKVEFPSLSERTFFRTRYTERKSRSKKTRRFHLFQREPSFGHPKRKVDPETEKVLFPSLSERTFFRTIVAIIVIILILFKSFHLFQREPSFGHEK